MQLSISTEGSAPKGPADHCGLSPATTNLNGERAIILCDCVLDIAVAMFNVCGRELRSPGRSTLEVSRVRQIAMYVCHVIFGMKMTDIGNGFGRDRTTVMHACHVIEDMRDDSEFDAIVNSFEKVAGAALKFSDGLS